MNSSTAVMASRHEAPDSLDFFPTPPWATRALCQHVLPHFTGNTVLEPAAGEGHMVHPLKEYFKTVIGADVHDYGKGFEIGSYVGSGLDVLPKQSIDWVITNPPFNLAEEFFERAVVEAKCGVALLMRTAWLEGGKRYRNVFENNAPTAVAVFSERVAMTKGRWVPSASTATSYAWFVWEKSTRGVTELMWIPPGQKTDLTHPSDYEFAAEKPE